VTLLWLISEPVMAQDNALPLSEAEQGTSDSNSKTVSTEPTEQTSVPEPEAKDPEEQSDSVIEILPPSAYPEPRTRGIDGGSLWMTFHGLQWPYYRKTGIGVSGYVWIDPGYRRLDNGHPNPDESNEKELVFQGRLLLRITPTYSNGQWFVQGQAELVADKDQVVPPSVVDADDVWIRVGMWDTFDLQLGRFESWEIYHFGMGLDLYTLERKGAGGPKIYGLTYTFERPEGSGVAAVHVYPTDFLRFEISSQLGFEEAEDILAVRPVGVLDMGWIKLKLGGEYKSTFPKLDIFQGGKIERGIGGGLQFVFDTHVEFGVNGGYGLEDKRGTNNDLIEKESFTVYSLGGFANARIIGDLLVGAGLNLTKKHDIHFDQSIGDYGRFDHLQTFIAVQYLFLEHLYTKLVLAYAKAGFDNNFDQPIYDNTMLSGRLRLMVLF